MITIKSDEEFAKMAQAGLVVAEIHERVRDAARPGVTLAEMDRLAAAIIRERDCTPSFLNYHGYPAHVCLSPNEVIVHGIPDDRRIAEGDVISLDAGAIYQGWHADAAITFGVGEITAEARRLVEATERAMWAGIAEIRPGRRLGDIGHAVESVAAESGFGVVREYTGHGIGRQMHEDPQVLNYGTPGTGMKLRSGMAVCIEPMFNLGSGATRVLDDGWSVVAADGSISAHFEHTVAVTVDGPRVLTGPR